MDEIIRKIIYNNCGIQDGATLIGYIEEILNRNEKAIEYIDKHSLFEFNGNSVRDNRARMDLLDILKGVDKK